MTSLSRRLFVFVLVLVFVFMVMIPTSLSRLSLARADGVKAFHGAEGCGTNTPGGRGGRVIYVSNLNDSGEGSLRAALEAEGPRIVLFQVSGTITLESDITLFNPFMTVAGQTAPGEGVQIRGAHLSIKTHDIIIRYLKIRSGDVVNSSNPNDRDSIAINHTTDAYNIVIDHSTVIWGPDVGGITILQGARDVTISYSIIGEGLYLSNHQEATVGEAGHSLGINISELDSDTPPTCITVHHNLITSSDDRNPRIIGGQNIDIVNNIIYNWRSAAAQGNPRSLNLIGNIFVPGPMTTKSIGLYGWRPKVESGGTQRPYVVYEEGNVGVGLTAIRGGPPSVYATTPFIPYSMSSHDVPEDAYNKVVADVGANCNVINAKGDYAILRDEVDQRIIDNLINHEGTYWNGIGKDGESGYPEIFWPDLAVGEPAIDSDSDGMPDTWEQFYFGEMTQSSDIDANSDPDSDGYTNLEEYLNYTNPLFNEPPEEIPTAYPTSTILATSGPTPTPAKTSFVTEAPPTRTPTKKVPSITITQKTTDFPELTPTKTKSLSATPTRTASPIHIPSRTPTPLSKPTLQPSSTPTSTVSRGPAPTSSPRPTTTPTKIPSPSATPAHDTLDPRATPRPTKTSTPPPTESLEPGATFEPRAADTRASTANLTLLRRTYIRIH